MPRVTRSNSTQDDAIDIASSQEEDVDDKDVVKKEVKAINTAAHSHHQKSQFVMIAPGN